jgi:predicted CxxxxCH...CXXCH cytochrome family protein
MKPLVYTDVGHLFDVDGRVITSAQVTFGPLAKADGAAPTWDGASCQGAYCHGATLHDPSATHTTPLWRAGANQALCGSCHGVPPASHANRPSDCSECHGRVVDVNRNWADPSLHVDGKVSLGDDSGTCAACHPSPGGAHASHTQAAHRLAPALDCSACHQVPTSVDSPGHIDHPDAVVFPIGSSALARTDEANPTWTAASSTCADVYCHGGGKVLANDATASVRRTPGWNDGPTAAECGACHGIPPADGAHLPGLMLTDCHKCHRTVDASGALVPATHINGIIDGP